MASLTDILGGSLIDSVKGIIAQFHMSPEDKAKLQAQLDQEKDAFTTAENDYNAKLNDIAGQNIRAEAQTNRWFVVCARPAVIWVGLFSIVWNYCGPLLLLEKLTHLPVGPIELPVYFWEAWSTISLGYVVNRTVEKVMSMPGDSSIKLPFGIQLGQNSK